MTEIIEATPRHIDQLAVLFDQYRVFYEQESNLEAAAHFLKERFDNKESVVLLAFHEKEPVGFTQLYSSFSSVSMQPVYILNDLFVLPEFRKKGIGEDLLEKAKVYCQNAGYKGLALETATDNPAQRLYERLGWQKDVHCFHYFWTA